MVLEIQVSAENRHKYVAELNWLMGSQYTLYIIGSSRQYRHKQMINNLLRFDSTQTKKT
jgi:hypothetical protein